MNLESWIPFYKYSDQGEPGCMSQQTYEPLVSPDGKTFCANYDWQNKYQRRWQPDRPLYTQEVVDYFFEKEKEYALRFQDKPWAPKIVDITDTAIFYKWNGPTCNEIIHSGLTMPEGWQKQIHDIMLDIFHSGVYKLTMYPHCHFFDSDGQMRTIDMYGCVEITDPYIDCAMMDGIIHSTAQFRLDETGETINDRYDLEKMFKRSLGVHVKWGTETLDDVYKEMFGNT
jgi:hypothetical protein